MLAARRAAFAITVAAASAGAVLGASACYDVDALRGGVRPGTTSDGAGLADARPPTTDAGDAGEGFCATANATFCDDFDEPLDAPFEDRWKGLAGVFPPIFIQGSATIVRGPGTITPLSRPYGVDIELDARSGKRATAVLTQSLGRPNVRAVELTAAIHAPTVTSDNPNAVDDAGKRVMPRVSLMGLGALAATDTVGASIVLRPDSLAVQSGIQSSTLTATNYAFITTGFDYIALVSSTWLVLHLVLGEKDAVVAQVTSGAGVAPTCPETATAVAAAWASFPFGRAACIEMPATLLPMSQRDIGFVVGPSVDDNGHVVISYDNAAAKVIP